jgi:hypothetical protein
LVNDKCFPIAASACCRVAPDHKELPQSLPWQPLLKTISVMGARP